MSTVHKIESVNQFNALLAGVSDVTLVALNFHAPWAAPCAQMNQVFETLAAQATSPKSPILFVSIDAEELPDISESYDVSAVPFFVLLKAHQIVRKLSGADPAELAKAIETHSGAPGFALPPPQKTAAPTTAGDAATADASEPAAEEDINTRLGKLVAAAPVMLFMKGTPSAPQCGFSRQLVGLLRDKGVRYGFFNILADDEVRQGLKTYSDWPTFPQLYVSGQLVGGLDIVKEEFENDPDFLQNVAAAAAAAKPVA